MKTKAVFLPIRIQNSSFYPIRIFGGLIHRTGDPYIPGQARVRVHLWFIQINTLLLIMEGALCGQHIYFILLLILLGDFETWLFVKGEKDIRPKVELPKLKPITFI